MGILWALPETTPGGNAVQGVGLNLHNLHFWSKAVPRVFSHPNAEDTALPIIPSSVINAIVTDWNRYTKPARQIKF
jgi:hypothetical protein